MTQTIAIVGAGPGVGLAVAERFAAEGFRVALLARNGDRVKSLAQGLRQKGFDAEAFPADVFDHGGLRNALDAAASHFGGIDVLEYGPVPTADSLRLPREIDVENEQFHLDLAVFGAITAVRAVLPGLVERRAGGLLFTTAASALYPMPSTASFGIAAGALLNYARILHYDLKKDGVYAGIVALAGLVVQRGDDHGFSPSGFPYIAAQDVADAHWRLFTERDTSETIVGDPTAVRKSAGLLA